MGFFRSIGKSVGNIGGGIVGGGVKLVGKGVGTKFDSTGKYIEEIGGGIHQASKIALDNAGQFIDGAVQGTYGLVTKDEYHKQTGWNDLKGATGRTVQGIGTTLSYTANSAGTTFRGLMTGDKEQIIAGTKNLGKVVAVSTLAIGLIDIADGVDIVEAEEIDTRNSDLNGFEHPETGVPFVEKTVELPNGEVVEGTFPVFDSAFNVVIAEDIYLESDSVHFQVANETLYQAIQKNPHLAAEIGLSQAEVEVLGNGITPEGYTWHHSEEPGVLQLVDEDVHENTGHTGGRSMWGGGTEYR